MARFSPVSLPKSGLALYDEDIEYPVMFHNGEGCMIVCNDVDVTTGLIETDDERVVEWVTEVFDTYWDAATLLAPEDLTGFRDASLTEA